MLSLTLDNETAMFDYLESFLSRTAAKQLSNTLSHHVKHHGREWTVSYLKDMKALLIQWYASGCQGPATVAKGSFKPVWRLPFGKALQVLNVFSAVKLTTISKKQASKFLNAVNSADGDAPSFRTDRSIHKAAAAEISSVRWQHPYSWIRCPNKRAPIIRKDGPIETIPETELDFNDLMSQLGMMDESSKKLIRRHASLYGKALNVPFYTIQAGLNGPRRDIFDHSDEVWWETTTGRPCVGTLGFIQERGAKLRVVANAFRHHQMVLTPLGDWVYKILVHLPWDCTFDQSKGHMFLQDALKQGKTVYCFDLSNATDRFPLSVQTKLIYELIEKAQHGRITSFGNNRAECEAFDETYEMLATLKRSLDLFSELARGCWYAPKLGVFNDHQDYVAWNRGQPLGLYPSFGLFALAHGNMVRDIESRLGLSDTFRVLGDDIIISHPEVAKKYRLMMEQGLGCEISESKSVTSSLVGEFAGKILTKEADVTPLKWSNFSVASPLRPVEILGLKGFRFVSGKYRKPIRRFVALPPPIGLGLNPQGLSLAERLDDKTLEWYWPKRYTQVSVKDLSYHDREVRQELVYNKLFHGSLPGAPWHAIEPPDDQPGESGADERLRVVHFNRVIAGLAPWEDLPPLVQVPTVERAPSRGDVRAHNVDQPSILSRVFKFIRNQRERIHSSQH